MPLAGMMVKYGKWYDLPALMAVRALRREWLRGRIQLFLDTLGPVPTTFV